MQRINRLAKYGLCFASAGGAIRVAAQTPTPYCDDDGGSTICVQYDNSSTQPSPTVDFDFDFTDPNKPSVTLHKGTKDSETRDWRVWCHDGGTPADIGTIQATAAYNFKVRILNASNGAGAHDIDSINLNPSGNFWGKVDGVVDVGRSHITGNLGDGFIKKYGSSV